MPNRAQNSPTFNAKLLQPVLLTAKHDGLLLHDILEQLNIDESQIDTPGKRYPVSVLAQLLSTLSELSDSPAFAVRAAEATQPRMLGNTGFAMCTASSFFESYQTLVNYSSLAFEGITLKLSASNQLASITLETAQQNSHLIAFFVGCLCNWSRWLTGSQIPVSAIKLTFSSSKFSSLEQYLASEILFESDINEVTFDYRYLNTPCLEANSDMHQLHCQYADTLLLQAPQSNTIISQTKVQIRQLIALHEHEPAPIRREEIASRLNMSLRTFQRKLHSAQSNFQDIYDQVRRESCLALIADESLNLGQISYRLGFANSSALQKAFKRWLNTTPSHYRQQLLQQKKQLSDAHQENESQRWFDNTTNLEQQAAERLNELSDFSTVLLSWLACFQHCQQALVSIKDLEWLTGNSIARLSIYLWPAQQVQLLTIEKEKSSDATTSLYRLQPPICADLLHARNPKRHSEQHFQIGQMLIHRQQIHQALAHFSHVLPEHLSDTQCHQLYTHCEALSTASSLSASSSQRAILLTVMITFSQGIDSKRETLIPLKLALLQCQIDNQDWPACNELIEQLSEHQLEPIEHLRLIINQSELKTAHYQFDDALELLLSNLTPLTPAISDNSANSTLINIALQIENLRLDNNCVTTQELDPPLAKALATALQKLVLIALKAREPLIAANATCALLPLVNLPENHYLRAFAYSHFSWICSWFGGHSEAAFHTTQLAMEFLDKVDSQVYLDCIYVLYSRVYHWFSPFNQGTEKLTLLLQATERPYIDHQVLLQQMRLCSGVSIQHILQSCNDLNLPEQNLPATLKLTQLCHRLIAQDVTVDQQETSQGNDFYQLFQVFYNFEEQHWQSYQHLSKDIENATPSHFIAIEANFICLVMQIHCLKHSNNLELSHRKIAAELARFEIWAQQCPENFAPPYALAKAIFASTTQSLQHASELFEQALNLLESSGHLQHKIIAYRYYSRLLKADKPHLSALCESYQKALHQQWLAVGNSD